MTIVLCVNSITVITSIIIACIICTFTLSHLQTRPDNIAIIYFLTYTRRLAQCRSRCRCCLLGFFFYYNFYYSLHEGYPLSFLQSNCIFWSSWRLGQIFAALQICGHPSFAKLVQMLPPPHCLFAIW